MTRYRYNGWNVALGALGAFKVFVGIRAWMEYPPLFGRYYLVGFDHMDYAVVQIAVGAFFVFLSLFAKIDMRR